MTRLYRSALISSLAFIVITPTFASGSDFWLNVGEVGGPLLWAAGLGSSMLQDGKQGVDHTLRTADGFLATLALTECLKVTVREKRPYSSTTDSFPSLHASLSFEVAAAQSYYHPKQALAWYGAATLIAYSRIPAQEHHWQDVVVGGFLGYGAGQLSVSSTRGWFLAPMYEKSRLGGSLAFSQSF